MDRNSTGYKKSMKPDCLPSTITVLFCSLCGITNRFYDIPKHHHYQHGKICKGKIEIGTYKFDRIKERAKIL
jgi:hypothetical protein